MREITSGKKTVTYHDHIDELPISRFNQANEYSLLDADIGNTPDAITRRLDKLMQHVRAKEYDSIVEEARNLRISIQMAVDHNNYKGLYWASHIDTINGVKLTDFSHENLRKVLDALSVAGMTMKEVREMGDEVKKKSGQS